MEERLQVRIEADIKNFQQGLNQVEKNLQRAEGIFQRSSKSAFQLENAIAQLSKEFKTGAISNNEYSARLAHLNAELTQQRSNVSASAKEIDRLNKLMDASRLQKVAVANNQVAGSFQGLSRNVRGSNTVALEFNRIVQDAPFGLIGVGNNIQQLAGNFSQLSRNAGGAVPAIKATFAALATGPNLALLAISAVTAGFTAYQMGAFGAKDANEKLKSSVDQLKEANEEYNESLKDTNKIMVEANYKQFLKDIGAIKREWVDFGNGQGAFVDVMDDTINVLDGFEKKVKDMREGELEKYKRFFETELVNAQRDMGNLDVEGDAGQISLIEQSISNYRDALNKVNRELAVFEKLQSQFDDPKGIKLEEIDVSEAFKIDLSNVDKQWEELITFLNDKIDKEKESGKIKNVKVNVDIEEETLTKENQKENDRIVAEWNKKNEEFKMILQNTGAQMEDVLARSFEGAILSGDNFFQAVEQGFKRMLARLASQLAASAAIKVLGMIIGGPVGGAVASGAAGGIGSLLFGGGAGMRVSSTPSVGMPTAGTSGPNYRVDVNVGGVIRGNDLYLLNQRNKRENDRWY